MLLHAQLSSFDGQIKGFSSVFKGFSCVHFHLLIDPMLNVATPWNFGHEDDRFS
jgi:hypothetical protein